MNHRGGPPRPLAGFLPLAPADVLAEAHRLHGAPPPYDPSASSPPAHRGTFPGDLDRMPSGHTRHCEARQKYGDGECECGVRPSREPGCDDGDEEPAPNSPADVGFRSSGTPSSDRGASEQKEPLAANLEDDGHKPASGGGARVSDAPAPAADGPEPRRCKSCDALIYWVQLVDEHGARQRRDDGKGWKAMPVDAQPDAVKGNVYCYRPKGARTLYGRVLRRDEPIPPGARLRTSHFATCLNAKHHRRNRR